MDRPSSVIDQAARMQFVPSGTRERILFTALELIAEEGYRGFSVNAVIRKGRFSKGSFFFHFNGLEDLCLACYELIRQLMLPTVNAGEFPSLRAFLEAFGKETLQATQTKSHFALVYFFAELAMTNPVFMKAQRDLTEHYQNNLVTIMRKFVGSRADEEVLRDMAAYISISLDGIASHRLLFADPLRMSRVWPLVMEQVIRTLVGDVGNP